MYQRVALVTGANQGIGFHIAKQLVQSGLFGTVVLGCRDAVKGAAAAAEVGGAFLQPLDVADAASGRAFADALRERYGRLDCLVNNAGMAFKGADPTPFAEQTAPTLQTNFYGTLALTEALLPLLREGRVSDARIVNVASMAGRLGQVSPALQRAFAAPDLTLPALRALVDGFKSDVAAGVHASRGWSKSNYGMSKLALIAATRVLARDEPDIRVNACCPGYCDTSMTSHKGPRPPAEGARNAVVLATGPRESCPTGAFYQDERPSEW
jgi:carbonyl reductase 1